ncbi:kinase [Candidatus Marinamargulisbacteria bacterium SCGC AG-333-B06]|nr:kinase [Candidatus Marinamargulisbacteria bacterium SCGC AG-333-B06]
MIITKTPLRVSFFGGGTDYPAWIKKHGGQVLSTAIDKYSYVSLRYLPPFFDHKYRISYSKLEYVKDYLAIENPVVRSCIKHLSIEEGLEIHYDSDLPARTGLGSSSAFTVGLLHSLYSLQGKDVSIHTLAKEAIYIEQTMIGDTVGCQDQIGTAYGGFNHITFHKDGSFKVKPIQIRHDRLCQLQDHLMLFFTGISRIASTIAKEQVKELDNHEKKLHQMSNLVTEAIEILTREKPLNDFGLLLDQTWSLKRQLSKKISNDIVDELYQKAITAGAIGAKLLGAGGGGFLLVFAPPECQADVKKALANFLHVPFSFDSVGTQLLFNANQSS